jgi:hypothetical protein
MKHPHHIPNNTNAFDHLSEFAENLAYTQGYRGAFSKPECSYKKGTALRRAYNKGRRDARREY